MQGKNYGNGKLSQCIAVCCELLLLYIYSLHQDNHSTNQLFHCIILDMIILLCQKIPNNCECFVIVLSSCPLHVVITPSAKILTTEKKIPSGKNMMLLKLFDLQVVDRRNIGRINMAHILLLYYPRNISQ
jgi:hypothetical protein